MVVPCGAAYTCAYDAGCGGLHSVLGFMVVMTFITRRITENDVRSLYVFDGQSVKFDDLSTGLGSILREFR